MSNNFGTVGTVNTCPPTGGEDSTKYYKIAALVLGFTFCIAMTAGFLFVGRAIRVVAEALHPQPDRTHGNETSGTKKNGGRRLGSERASLRRILGKKCCRGWAIGVATVLAALASEPPSVNVNLAEVALPAPATASQSHRRA